MEVSPSSTRRFHLGKIVNGSSEIYFFYEVEYFSYSTLFI